MKVSNSKTNRKPGARGGASASIRDPEQEGARCSECPLKGHKPVFGGGNPNAEVAIVGEAPGANEIQAGKPFVGASGSLLEAMLSDEGVARSDFYITNALLCMPPGGNLEDWSKNAKRDYKATGRESFWRSPIDCCRPRLFRELGIAICKTCDKWQYGPEDLKCRCRRPQLIQWPGRLRNLKAVHALGNAALQSMTGAKGIQRYRGSPIDMSKPLEKQYD
jgi:uracil-DNA glycosylase family 4